MTAQPALVRHAPATVEGRYLVRPARGEARHHWIGFHGQSQTAESLLEAFEASAPGDDWLVASVQALHPYYTSRGQQVVAGWMTRLDRESAIASNVAYVDEVVARIEAEFGAPRTRIFAGFSQGVGMAYRAGLLGRHACHAIVAVGGDVPPELAELARAWPRVLLMAGEQDPYFPPASAAADAAKLRALGAAVRERTFPGKHEWPEAASRAAAEFARELAERAAT